MVALFNQLGAAAKYIAISINVMFHAEEEDKENQEHNMMAGQAEETQWTPMSSLSAGQKTVVTIALIFALQRCDPVNKSLIHSH